MIHGAGRLDYANAGVRSRAHSTHSKNCVLHSPPPPRGGVTAGVNSLMGRNTPGVKGRHFLRRGGGGRGNSRTVGVVGRRICLFYGPPCL